MGTMNCDHGGIVGLSQVPFDGRVLYGKLAENMKLNDEKLKHDD